MRVLSLFSGGGLGDYGLELSGMEIVGQVEIDDYCKKILKLRWPNVPKWEDIRNVTGKEVLERAGAVDLISGGFPCQPFSVAGKKKGKDDERNMWPEMFRLIREIKPTWVFAENVRGIVKPYLDTVLADLETLGYTCLPLLVPACALGAPHRRERLWIVGYSKLPRSSSTSVKRSAGQTVCDNEERKNKAGEFTRTSTAVPDANECDAQRKFKKFNGEKIRKKSQERSIRFSSGARQWSVEPNVGRVAHGCSSELDASIRRLTNETEYIEKAITEIDNLRRKILQRMWGERESPKTSLRPSCKYLRYLMSIVSCELAQEEWNMGSWIASKEDLRNLWEKFHASPFQEGCDLLEKLLVGIREAERQQKMASNRVNRLKVLGNGQVVQVVEWIGNQIMEFELKTLVEKK